MPETVRTPRPGRPASARRPRRHRKFAYSEFVDTFGPALALTVIVHLLLVKGASVSGIFENIPAAPPATKAAAPRPVFRAPAGTTVPANLLPPQMRPEPPRFVEVNPQAPSLKPNHARNTGAADQRAAQPLPEAVTKSDRPRTAGDEPGSTRIVQAVPREFLPKELRPEPGQPVGSAAPAPAEPASPDKASDGPGAPADLPESKPKSDLGAPFAEKRGTQPPDTAGKGDRKSEHPSPERRDGDKSDKTPTSEKKNSVSVESAQRAEPAPRPRPRATLAGTAGPLGISTAGVSDAGITALDARFSRMGEYSSRMLEIIQAAWWAGAERSRIAEGGRVVVEFTLNKNGSVTGAHIVEKTTSDRAAWLCLDAVTGRAPFDPWPEDMVGMLGEKQEGRITFHYR